MVIVVWRTLSVDQTRHNFSGHLQQQVLPYINKYQHIHKGCNCKHHKWKRGCNGEAKTMFESLVMKPNDHPKNKDGPWRVLGQQFESRLRFMSIQLLLWWGIWISVCMFASAQQLKNGFSIRSAQSVLYDSIVELANYCWVLHNETSNDKSHIYSIMCVTWFSYDLTTLVLVNHYWLPKVMQSEKD